MEISPQLMQQLQVVFKAELAEHLETLTNGLLVLEQGGDAGQRQELLENIFRAAHSLKGAAKGVSQHAIADITHRLESIFSLLKKGQLTYSSALFDTLLQAVDKIRQVSETPETDLQAFNAFLKKLDDCLSSNPGSPPAPVSEKNTLQAFAKKTAVKVEKQPSLTVALSSQTEKNPSEETVPLTVESSPQISYTVLAQDVNRLSLLADEVQTARLQLKKHLLDFQQLCFNLDQLSNNLSEHVSYQSASKRDEKLSHSLIELTHLSTDALNSLNSLRQLNNLLHQTSQSLTSSVNTMRLLPFAMLLAPLQRIVRDLSQQQQKKLQFVIEGEEIKIDRNLYKVLHAPLVHLINNAIDHGIDLPQQRLAQGKPEQALLRLKISKVAANIVIILSDDGGGIDLNALRQKIIKMQLLSADEANALSNEAAVDFIFKSGFSMAPILTEISGRGIGLDVVRTNLRKIKGTISVKTVFKQGTEFILTLPASLTSESGILIQAGGTKFALQGYSIERVIDVDSETLLFLNGKNLFLKVKTAFNSEPLRQGTVYLAPDNCHCLVHKNSSQYEICLSRTEPVNGFRPSVTALLNSVAAICPKQSIGIILSGMGSDGAEGLQAMFEQQCLTIAQDETSSIVFGMPAAAIALNAVSKVLPLEAIARFLIEQTSIRKNVEL